MSISEKELRDILKIQSDLEKLSTVSSDGKNLLTRIPVSIRKQMNIQKGDKIRWLLKDNAITLEVISYAKKED